MTGFLSRTQHAMGQSFWIPEPTLTEQNAADQSGRVFLVTGGYAGVGLELVNILYSKNATVYVAGRNEEKASPAIKGVQERHADSKGAIHFLHVDLSDLPSLKAAAEDFASKEKQLHVLVNNAGIMIPPKGSKNAQGYEIQMATNCMGAWIFTKHLAPLLESTAAASPPNTVRVCWAGSLAIDTGAPTGGVPLDENTGAPTVTDDPTTDYSISKAGNYLMCHEFAQLHPSIVNVCFNPGNLQSDLQRHIAGIGQTLMKPILHPAVYGGYTELYCAISPELTTADNGTYIAPWGRKSHVREDIQASTQGEPRQSAKFVEWIEKEGKW